MNEVAFVALIIIAVVAIYAVFSKRRLVQRKLSSKVNQKAN
jgi:hypothetical protein